MWTTDLSAHGESRNRALLREQLRQPSGTWSRGRQTTDRSTVMPTSPEWLVGVVDAAMQGWTPHDKETAVARTGLRCEDTQGSGLVDTSNSKKAVVGGNVDDRPFSARRIKESRATPGAAKAAFGDLEQRTADYEEGFVDGALSATKLAADRLGKACGQVLELEDIIRRRDAAIG